MGESEAARLAYYNHLREELGEDNADAIMTHVPTQPVSKLATQSDTDRLETRFDRLENRSDRLETRVDRLETRVDRLESEMRAGFTEIHAALREQYRNYSILTIGSLTALTAIFSVIVGLIT